MKKIILFLLTFMFMFNVKAYENNYFSIDIPDNYIESSGQNGLFSWINKDNSNENIIVTIVKNDESNNVEEYTEENINEYKEYLKEQLDEELNEYNISVDISDVKIKNINNNKTLNYAIYWPTKESIGYDIYQKGYVFTKKNYVYVCTFTSDKSIDDNEIYSNIINSFTIKDENIVNIKYRIKIMIIVGASAAIISYIITAIKKRH